MSIQKLRTIARRGSLFGAVFAIVAATFASAVPTYADALNPLTDRSLTLSSSAPGWDNTDGSGNSTYAQPNSGANGYQTGNTFSFKVSTDTSSSNTVKGITFQYCTKSAGDCMGPGNIVPSGSTRASNVDARASKKSDLQIVADNPSEVTSAVGPVINTDGSVKSIPARTSNGQNFVVLTKTGASDTWEQNAGWEMATSVNQTVGGSQGTIAANTSTGKENYVTLTNTDDGLAIPTGTEVKVIFFGTDTNFITNPGAGSFFVKINDYSDTALTTLVDGGVTVANVMNQSIEIQTKVLETMDFSVGTVDPYMLSSDDGDNQLVAADPSRSTHGQCDPILKSMTPGQTENVLQLGDQTAENSLRTDKTYSTHSYWRLSSNSSAGATVYYSGNTLSNTVGDKIEAMGTTAKSPSRGTPQFGLALANGAIADPATNPTYAVNYGVEQNPAADKGLFENGADKTANTQGIDPTVGIDTADLTGYHAPQLAPLAPEANYDLGAGNVNGEYGSVGTKFAFDADSNLIPAPIASESDQVVDCVTAKVRYIANIAATTPAGIYTTKINYIAAPQY